MQSTKEWPEGCVGCEDHLGGGFCRSDQEQTCGMRGCGQYRPKPMKTYTRAEFLETCMNGYASEAMARKYIKENKKKAYTAEDVRAVRDMGPNPVGSKVEHIALSRGLGHYGWVRSTKSYSGEE